MENAHSNIISIKDFENGWLPTTSFILRVGQLFVGQTAHKNVPLEVSYDKQARLRFRCVLPTEQVDPFGSVETTITATDDSFECALDFLSTQVNRTTDGATAFLLRLKREVISFKSCTDIAKLEAIVINGPEIIFGSMRLDFEIDGFQLSLQEYASVREFRKNKEYQQKTIATGLITLIHRNGTVFSSIEGCKLIHRFIRFLTFVRGAYCGVGHFIGSDKSLGTNVLHLGFTKSDPFILSRGWCDMAVIRNIPAIYTEYSKIVELETNTRPLLRAIEFYRASTLIRESSLEMGIVASYASLETLVPHLLESKAGWSKEKIEDRNIGFFEKLRSAALFIDIKTDPLEHNAELIERAKLLGNIDAYELISRFRNRIVHQGKQFHYTGLELVGVWNLSQWLCELFLFYWFDYRGQMTDRRKLHGWRGDTVTVPLHTAIQATETE